MCIRQAAAAAVVHADSMHSAGRRLRMNIDGIIAALWCCLLVHQADGPQSSLSVVWRRQRKFFFFPAAGSNNNQITNARSSTGRTHDFVVLSRIDNRTQLTTTVLHNSWERRVCTVLLIDLRTEVHIMPLLVHHT